MVISTKIKTAPDAIKRLWEQGFFKKKRDFQEIKAGIEDLGCHPIDTAIHNALKNVKFVTRHGSRGEYRYGQAFSPDEPGFDDVLPQRLETDLTQHIAIDISDLKLVYGRSGTCTAFMLRKILERLLFLTFAKHGFSEKLKSEDGLVGLKTMLTLAENLKVGGKPFLMPKTAREIAGIKFLGDTSAHNPLVNVEMGAIKPVMPFIITAYDELSKKL